jgi:hypothetical protein
MIRKNIRVDYILNPYDDDWRMSQQCIEGFLSYSETVGILKSIQREQFLKPTIVGLKVEDRYYSLGSKQVTALQKAI